MLCQFREHGAHSCVLEERTAVRISACDRRQHAKSCRRRMRGQLAQELVCLATLPLREPVAVIERFSDFCWSKPVTVCLRVTGTPDRDLGSVAPEIVKQEDCLQQVPLLECRRLIISREQQLERRGCTIEQANSKTLNGQLVLIGVRVLPSKIVDQVHGAFDQASVGQQIGERFYGLNALGAEGLLSIVQSREILRMRHHRLLHATGGAEAGQPRCRRRKGRGYGVAALGVQSHPTTATGYEGQNRSGFSVSETCHYYRVFLHRSALSDGPPSPPLGPNSNIQALILVLPVRIELTTSPLPRGCSTTELRQHWRGTDGAALPPKPARSLP